MKSCILKSVHIQLEPVRQVLPFDWLTTDHLVSGESTLHQVTGYEFTGYTFFSSIENFSAYQPSLARLYSAAASPSERVRLDGSLAISPRGEGLNEGFEICLSIIPDKKMSFFLGPTCPPSSLGVLRRRTTNYGWTSVVLCLKHWVESCKYRTLRLLQYRQ